jgi:hypothetical protein
MAFGADPTGATGPTTAFDDALAAAQAVPTVGGGRVLAPPGQYYLQSGITVPAGVELIGSGMHHAVRLARGCDLVKLDGTPLSPFLRRTVIRKHRVEAATATRCAARRWPHRGADVHSGRIRSKVLCPSDRGQATGQVDHTVEGVAAILSPFKRPAEAEHLLEGLRKAGLPER